jgi:hypothetical protein
MNCITRLFALMFFQSLSVIAFAQDDLLLLLKEETADTSEPVIATFKGNKIINIETNETVKRRNLDVRISHLFGNMGTESGGGIHNFYGFDQSEDIRIGLHYGITKTLMIGVSRAKRNENFEGLMKYRVLQQTTDDKIPFAFTLFGNTTYTIRSEAAIPEGIHRFTYCLQGIIARKFSSRFSLIIAPAWVHRNFTAADDENNTFSLSGGFRFKFTKSASVIGDYSHTFGRENILIEHTDAIGAGIEIETGGHVFTLMFTNASGLLENDFLVNTTDVWGKGGFKFSFIISRMFRFGKEN